MADTETPAEKPLNHLQHALEALRPQVESHADFHKTYGEPHEFNEQGDQLDKCALPECRIWFHIQAEIASRKVPKPAAEVQPVKGDGGVVVETKMALPISDPERMLKHHVRIEATLTELAKSENISLEAAYKWAGDMLEHFANLTENEEKRERPKLRWGRILAVIATPPVVILAGYGLSRLLW